MRDKHYNIEILVAHHLMRAGWAKTEEHALGAAQEIVLTVLTGLRWDIDFDQRTKEHYEALKKLRRAGRCFYPEDVLSIVVTYERAAHANGMCERRIITGPRKGQSCRFNSSWYQPMYDIRVCGTHARAYTKVSLRLIGSPGWNEQPANLLYAAFAQKAYNNG